jgi:hypothetical protein
MLTLQAGTIKIYVIDIKIDSMNIIAAGLVLINETHLVDR